MNKKYLISLLVHSTHGFMREMYGEWLTEYIVVKNYAPTSVLFYRSQTFIKLIFFYWVYLILKQSKTLIIILKLDKKLFFLEFQNHSKNI